MKVFILIAKMEKRGRVLQWAVIFINLFFLAEVYKSYQKLTLEILKKSTYLVKVPFFPLIPFHIKKKTKSPPLQYFFRY